MRYSGSLVKKEREEIFKLFLENTRLRFSEIEKALKIRSNMVSYHIQRMQKEGLIEKKNGFYSLTKNAEKYLPILSNIIGQALSPIPIVLIALISKNKILLMKRNRRPYKDYWGLIGGKMLLEESFKEASLRLIKEKSSIEGKYISMNYILHERVIDGITKYSFILFLTKVLTKKEEFNESHYGKLKWFDIKNIEKSKIISSDLWLIKNKLNSKINVKSAYMLENKGKLSSLRFKK